MESVLKHKSVTPECIEALKKLEDKVKYSYSVSNKVLNFFMKLETHCV